MTRVIGYSSEEQFSDELQSEGSSNDENDIFAAAVAAAAKQRRSADLSQDSMRVDAQLESYYVRFSSKSAPPMENELEFWDNNADYPILKDVAISVLAIPATSAPVERIFSIAGNILADERSRLSDTNLENQVMVRVNKKLFSSLLFK